MSHRNNSLCLLLGLLLSVSMFAVPAKAASPFCSDSDCKATQQFFIELCDYIAQNRSNVPKIYTGAYFMRTLVAGYEILGRRRYLDLAIAYADGLLKKQLPGGYWGTGYGDIFIADTGSALGLFSVLYKHVDKARQEEYRSAVQRYFQALRKDGMIHPSGGLGGGWYTTKEGAIKGPITGEDNVSTALTGGEIFVWLYHVTKDDQYRQLAFKSMRWSLGPMNPEGVIANVDPEEGADPTKVGDSLNDYHVWDAYAYITSGYVGEGLIAFDLYSDRPDWKAELRSVIAPHIQFLLRTQNADGSWGRLQPPEKTMCSGKMDLTRSPGVVNLLIWYYENVNQDSRIVQAVQAFDRFLLNPESAKNFGLLNAGAAPDEGCSNTNTVTSLTGRAVADIIAPGAATKW